MTDDVNARLDEIFNARSQKEAEALRIKNEIQQKQKSNLQDFLELQESLIRPTLESLAQKLKDRGHNTKVFDIADGEQISGSTRVASIGIQFLLDTAANYRNANEYPHVTLTVEKNTRTVHFSYSTMSPSRGGSAGGAGSVSFEALTPELINDKVIKVISDLYK